MIYYAKIEPIATYNVKSAVSGKVIYTNKDLEATLVKNSTIVKIDDIVNKTDYEQTKIKLANLNKIYKIEKNTLKSFQKVSSKSKFDKDNQQIKILNISSNISDLKTKLATLQNTIENKTLKETNKYISDILVEVGDYVNPGTPLYTAYNLTKAKLTFFIPIDLTKQIQNKVIYFDNKPTKYKITKLHKVANSTNISSYECEIQIDRPEQFSKLIKVEFR
jgi:multidrug resistance efflux pump